MTAKFSMEAIQELLDASSDDEVTLSFEVPNRIYGFHGQQAVEKPLKVLVLLTAPITSTRTTSKCYSNLLSMAARLCLELHTP